MSLISIVTLCTLINISICSAQLQRDTTVNALTPSLNGVSITHNPVQASTSGSWYNISVTSQSAYDLYISLSTQWSFKATVPTTLLLTLDGSTPNPTGDADFIIVFTVDNTHFFSFFIHLDTLKVRSKVYPYNKLATVPNILSMLSDTVTHPQRWDRVSNNDQWQVTMPRYNAQGQWPLQFKIENDIALHTCNFSYFDQGTTFKTSNVFNTSFPANKPMNIYIMGDTTNEMYQISSVNIQLYHATGVPTMDPTLAPIGIPTHNPTVTPTETPTNPTQTPTNIPTQNPTDIPTKNPTILPSETPTLNPTKIPSQNPTEIPTLIPTENPTQIPTENPTQIPSQNPTDIPTGNPTQIPTENPTNVPSYLPTNTPTEIPNVSPTKVPSFSVIPTVASPSYISSTNPTVYPTHIPSIFRTTQTNEPTNEPTYEPTLEPTLYTYTIQPTNEPTLSTSTTTSMISTVAGELIESGGTKFDLTSYVVIIIVFTMVCFGAITVLLVIAKHNKNKMNQINKEKTMEVIAVANNPPKRGHNSSKMRSYEKVDPSAIAPAYNTPLSTIGNDNDVGYDNVYALNSMIENITDLREKGMDINKYYTGNSGTVTDTTTTMSKLPNMNKVSNNVNTHYYQERDGRYEETETTDMGFSEEETKEALTMNKYESEDRFVDRTMPNPFSPTKVSESKSQRNYLKKLEVSRYISTSKSAGRKRIDTNSRDFNDTEDDSEGSSSDDSYHNRMGTYEFVENMQVLHEHSMNIKTNNNSLNVANVLTFVNSNRDMNTATDLSLRVLPGDSRMNAHDEHYTG